MDKRTILKRIISYYNFPKEKKFAEFIGVLPQTLSNWKRRGTYNPETLYTKCVELNPQWVITGEGSMLKSEYISTEEITEVNDPASTGYSGKKNFQNIPLYELGVDFNLKETLQSYPTKIPVSDFVRIPNLEKCDGATYVKGNSMLPILKNGDIIAFKGVSTDNLFWGELYLIETILDDKSTFLAIRYIQKSDLGDNHIKMVSKNPNYESKDISLEKINAIALIRASIQFQ